MHVLRKVLYNWSWIRIGTYDNELQASTAVKSRFHVGTWSTITAIHLVFFSRSHYEFIIVRATRVSFRRIRKEEREVPRGKICRTDERRKKAHDGNDNDDDDDDDDEDMERWWWRLAFLPERPGEPTRWTQRDRTVPDALLRRQPSRPRRGYEGHRGPASRIPMRFCRST